MKRKTLRILAVSALLAFGVVGCDGGSDAGSSETSSVEADEDIAGKVTIDNKKFKSEILPGEENAFNLEDCVTVKRATRWRIATESDNIKIDGHKVIGLDYGPWKATIIAGTTRRAISGYVVSEDKAVFNAFFSSISDNYMSYSAISGMRLAASDYYLDLNDVDATAQKYKFVGGMESEDKWYSFSIDASASFAFDSSSFEVDPGYTSSKESAGFGTIALDPTDIHEYIYDDEPYCVEQDDGNGGTYEVYGYTLLPITSATTGKTDDTNIENFLEAIGQNDYWYYMSKSYNATYLLIQFAPDYSALTMYPCSDKGIIASIEESGTEYSTAISLEMVNEVKVEAVENWIKSPVLPTAIDVSPVQDFFDKVNDERAYTLDSYGEWYNPKTGEGVDCPFHFSDNATAEVFSDYSARTAVNGNMHEESVITLSSDYGYAEYVSPAGQTNLTFVDVNDGKAVKSATGTYDSKTKKTTYGDVKTNSTATWDDLWDTTYTPCIFASDYLQDDDKNSYDFLSLVSFRSVTTGDSSKKYAFNCYGEDYETIGLNEYVKGAAGMASSLAGDAPYYFMMTIAFQSWEDYVDFSFEVANDGSWLKFDADFNFNSTSHFHWGWTMSDVGTDNVSEEAKALLTPAKSGDTSSDSGSATTGDSTSAA